MLQRRDDLPVDPGADDKRIDDGFDRVRFVLVEFEVIAQILWLPVDAGPAIAVDANLLEQVLVVLAVNLVDRRPHFDFRSLGQRQHVLHHLVRRADCDRLFAHRTVRCAHGREEHPQIVRDVGHRADGRTWVRAHRLLVDRNNRRKAVDEIDVRLFQLPHEAFCKRRHRGQQPPLAFGIHRVEGQRRLARTAHARNDDQLVAWDLQADVLKIVFARPLDFDRGSHMCSSYR